MPVTARITQQDVRKFVELARSRGYEVSAKDVEQFVAAAEAKGIRIEDRFQAALNQESVAPDFAGGTVNPGWGPILMNPMLWGPTAAYMAMVSAFWTGMGVPWFPWMAMMFPTGAGAGIPL